jgi:hypothetical protein
VCRILFARKIIFELSQQLVELLDLEFLFLQTETNLVELLLLD